MTRAFAACLLAAASLLVAPLAGADPADLVPYCSADQTPVDSNCQPTPHQVFTDDAPGANPEVPLGTNPGFAPVT